MSVKYAKGVYYVVDSRGIVFYSAKSRIEAMRLAKGAVK